MSIHTPLFERSKRMVRRTSLFAVMAALAAMVWFTPAANAIIYDFEGLTTSSVNGSPPPTYLNPLSGQDGWTNVVAGSPDAYGVGIVTTGSGNATKYAAIGGYSRLNNGTFFTGLNPASTEFGIQVDIKWGSGGYWTLGYDYNGVDGITEVPGEVNGYFYDGGTLQVNMSGWIETDPSWSSPTSYEGDWVRVLMSIDWTTGTYGTLRAYTMSLTDGAADYTPVIFNVGGSPSTTIALNSTWNTWKTSTLADPNKAGFMYRQLTGLDNIFIGQLPEPASLSLVAIGSLMVLRRRRA